jgi:hypothetical protein
MRRGNYHKGDCGVATMIEYIMISGVLMGLFVVMLLLVNANFMEGPADTIAYSAFTDVGNGVSTRIVDTYAIAPAIGNITSNFDIPDDIAGQNYFVEIGNTAGDDPTAQTVTVWRNSVKSSVGIAGIGSTRRAGGNTTGTGMNRISYDSGGF